MDIYPKVLPYVYQCIHKTTGKIYIGSRTTKNLKLSSYLDFPIYKTSSKIVKPIFDEFDWYIVAEFFDGQDAYDFEQQLIHEQWQISKEMSLNRICHHGKRSWNNKGGYNLSEEIIKNMRKPKSESHKNKMRKPKSESHKQNLRKPKTEEHIRNMKKPRSESHKQNLRKPKTEEHIRNRSKIIDVLTPDGFVIENITMKELCSQFNLIYISLYKFFKKNRSYKGFILL